MINEIKDLLSTCNKKSWVLMIKRRKEMYDFIINLYPLNDYQLNESLYLIMNDIKPTIAPCGSRCKFINGAYENYCDKGVKPKSDNSHCHICHEHWCTKKQLATKKNCIENYGVEYHWQRDDVKEKIIETNIEKYGVSHNSNAKEVVEKRKNNSIEKYGVSHPMHRDDIKNKVKQTNIERYGVENVGILPEVVAKRKSTMIERYGVENALYSSSIKDKVKLTNSNSRFINIQKQIKNNDDYIELFESDDLISSTNETELPFYCNSHGGMFKSSYKYGVICDVCYPKHISSLQHDITTYIKTLTDCELITNDRTCIDKELDIYIPSLQLAFEVNGMFWHRSEIRGQDYHQDKVLKCKNAGVKLIHIFEDEWYYKKSLIKQRLKSIFGVSDRIFARNCIIKEISHTESDTFINEHHIQGNAMSSINIGLFYNDELVSLMTFGLSRFDKAIQYELIRYCSVGTVVGGASKLLKYFERTYNPTSLLTYADMNWSSGNLYNKIGFTYNSTTKPGYFYYNPKTNTRISRYKCQKHKLVKMGYDPKLTETEICCDILGYYKIYDSGNLKFTKYYK